MPPLHYKFTCVLLWVKGIAVLQPDLLIQRVLCLSAPSEGKSPADSAGGSASSIAPGLGLSWLCSLLPPAEAGPPSKTTYECQSVGQERQEKKKKRRVRADGRCGYHQMAWAGSNLKDHLFPLRGQGHLPPDQVTQMCRMMWGNQACPSRTTSYLSIKPPKTRFSPIYHPSKFFSGAFPSGVTWKGKFWIDPKYRMHLETDTCSLRHCVFLLW